MPDLIELSTPAMLRDLGYAPAFDMEGAMRDYAAWYRARAGVSPRRT
jgi:nucleoside-diphosphate-sugar epimerase